MEKNDNLVLSYLQQQLAETEKRLTLLQTLIGEQKKLMNEKAASQKNNAFLRLVSTAKQQETDQ